MRRGRQGSKIDGCVVFALGRSPCENGGRKSESYASSFAAILKPTINNIDVIVHTSTVSNQSRSFLRDTLMLRRQRCYGSYTDELDQIVSLTSVPLLLSCLYVLLCRPKFPVIMSAARSATAYTVARMFPLGMMGMILASTTLRFRTPLTLS